MDWAWVAVIASLVLAATMWLKGWRKDEEAPITKFNIGDITLESLAQYCGYDYSKPILVAIKGKVYDVTKAADQFMPGKPLHVYAGREIARALAKGSTAEEDCSSESLHDLDQAAAERLEQAVATYQQQYDCVGQVVPMQQLTPEELGQYDGVAVPGSKLLLAIQGTVYDVSKGRNFYGPEGVYPFAGKECARALALMSTELSDCNDKVDDLGYMEREALRDWIAKFTFKYPVVGRIVPGKSSNKEAATSS